MRNARVEPLRGGSVVPSFRGIYLERFLYLIEGIDDLTNVRQREAFVRELEWCGLQVAETLDRHRYRATLMVLRDLTGQGWRVQYRYKSVFLVRPDYTHGKMPLDPLTVKAQIREAMQEERLARLLAPTAQKFVRQLERNNPPRLGIQALVGDGRLLAERLQRLRTDSTVDDLRGAVSPYLQLVTGEEKDKYTGIRLIDVWRYFRYLWAIPNLPTPGRNLFYLVRDAGQVNHPIIGIAALGNSIVQLSERDNRIGWSIEGLESRLNRKSRKISHTLAPGSAETIEYLESEQEYHFRIDGEASLIAKCLTRSMERELATISLRNLVRASEIRRPTSGLIDRLLKVAADSEHERREGLRDSETSGESPKRSDASQAWKKDSEKPLYRRKRAQVLADLFFAREQFRITGIELEPEKALRELLSTDNGRKALRIALHANKKTKIGSSMMDLIVCGAIPPYGELLGGKLVAMLMTSPQVILDYKKRYGDQPSEITSRLAGRPIVREADLVFLGTTSLYYVGSSQYERIKVPGMGTNVVRYERLGHTEGYGSSILSSETASQLKQLVIRSEGMRRVNNVFGEGVSPRLRQIRDGLNALGIPQETVLKHSCPRIIYGVCLANNAFAYLRGEEDHPDFSFDLKHPAEATEKIADFWLQRWLQPRSQRPETIRKLVQFSPNDLLVSNEFVAAAAPESMSMQMETN
jgi:Domain of unknown function (DUF4338)